jgi:hypothetical protein
MKDPFKQSKLLLPQGLLSILWLFAEKIRYTIEENKRNELEHNERMAAMQEAENKMAIAAHKKVKSHFLSSKGSWWQEGERERRIHEKHFAKLLWPLFDGSALQGQSHCDAPRNRPKFGTPTF